MHTVISLLSHGKNGKHLVELQLGNAACVKCPSVMYRTSVQWLKISTWNSSLSYYGRQMRFTAAARGKTEEGASRQFHLGKHRATYIPRGKQEPGLYLVNDALVAIARRRVVCCFDTLGA